MHNCIFLVAEIHLGDHLYCFVPSQDILRGIMSRLTLKEAMRMSILSRKWRRLCKCYPKLVFTRATMHNNNAIVDHRKPMQLRFIRGVNSVMRQLRPANLDKFVIKFSLRKRHTSHQ